MGAMSMISFKGIVSIIFIINALTSESIISAYGELPPHKLEQSFKDLAGSTSAKNVETAAALMALWPAKFSPETLDKYLPVFLSRGENGIKENALDAVEQYTLLPNIKREIQIPILTKIRVFVKRLKKDENKETARRAAKVLEEIEFVREKDSAKRQSQP